MYLRIVSVLMLVTILGVAVGCGGGAEQGDSGSGQKDKAEKRQEQRKKDKKDDESGAVGKAKVVEGVVTKVDTGKDLLWVKPEDADKSTLVRIRPEGLEKILLNGEQAAEGDIKKGQPAAVRYVPIEVQKQDNENAELNVARIVRLGAEGGAGGGEETG